MVNVLLLMLLRYYFIEWLKYKLTQKYNCVTYIIKILFTREYNCANYWLRYYLIQQYNYVT